MLVVRRRHATLVVTDSWGIMQIPAATQLSIRQPQAEGQATVRIQAAAPIEFAWSREVQQLNTVVHLDLIDQGMLALPISCCVREYAHLMVRGGV